MCLDSSCSNGSPPVVQSGEAVSTSNITDPDTYKREETSSDCRTDERLTEQSDDVEKQKESDNMSAFSQNQNNDTTASAAFYFRPGTNCYESFGDIVKSANKTSKLAVS